MKKEEEGCSGETMCEGGIIIASLYDACNNGQSRSPRANAFGVCVLSASGFAKKIYRRVNNVFVICAPDEDEFVQAWFC